MTLPGKSKTVLVDSQHPHELQKQLKLNIPSVGQGDAGLLQSVGAILDSSVNTWNVGFLDKLYASPDAAGLASELLLATLNTNVHVYAVSPALTLIEKHVTRALAALFGLMGEESGGVSMPGGAASNTTSMLIARNTMFPETKTHGIAAISKPLVLFASVESHYSIASAAAFLGLGSSAVWSVPVDGAGAMDVSALESLIGEAQDTGHQPFYVCATAGTTVRGAYDTLRAISEVCQRHDLWLHVDGSWGGPAIFSTKHRWKLDGSELADSIAINPHKMMGVPLTCSILLGKDLRKFYSANALSAGYLFHKDSDDVNSAPEATETVPPASEVFDLASFTPQCGRRGDSLKLYLAWVYYGSQGFEKQIDNAFAMAGYLAGLIVKRDDMLLVSDNPPPCCQVCLYFVGRNGKSLENIDKRNRSLTTRSIVNGLVQKGWMVDYAPGEQGEFLRVVVNRGCTEGIMEGLVKAIADVGHAATVQ